MAFFIVYAIIVPAAGGAGVGVCCRALKFYLQGDITGSAVGRDDAGAGVAVSATGEIHIVCQVIDTA